MRTKFRKMIAILLTASMIFSVAMPAFAMTETKTITYSDDGMFKTISSKPTIEYIAEKRSTNNVDENADYAITSVSDVYMRSTTTPEMSGGAIWLYAFSYTTTIYYKMGYGIGPGDTVVETGRPINAETVITEHDDNTFKLTEMKIKLGHGGIYYAATGGYSLDSQGEIVTELTTVKANGFEVGDRALAYYNTEHYYSLSEVSSGFAARTYFTGVRGTSTVTATGKTVELGQFTEIMDI